nr:dihydrofolate reductase-like [Penaeus vannamei]
MKVSLIVAKAENEAIGKDNDLIWHLRDDLRYFSEITKGHHVIMGRMNYDSIPDKYRPLPNRENIVVTRNKAFHAEGVTADSSLIPSTLDTAFSDEVKKQKVLDINLGIKERNDKDSVSNLSRSIFFGFDYRIVLGYDNDTYFGGMILLGTNTKQDFTQSSFSSDYSVVELYFGKRMNLHLRRKEKRKKFD